MTQPGTLLAPVKDYLDITWPDELTGESAKLTAIISRGIKYIDRLAGRELDYLNHQQGMALLLDYCRYVRSDALDVFQTNYLHELNALQLDEGAMSYAEAEGEPTI